MLQQTVESVSSTPPSSTTSRAATPAHISLAPQNSGTYIHAEGRQTHVLSVGPRCVFGGGMFIPRAHAMGGVAKAIAGLAATPVRYVSFVKRRFRFDVSRLRSTQPLSAEPLSCLALRNTHVWIVKGYVYLSNPAK